MVFAFFITDRFKKAHLFFDKPFVYDFGQEMYFYLYRFYMGFGSWSDFWETVGKTGFGSDASEISDPQIWKKL